MFVPKIMYWVGISFFSRIPTRRRGATNTKKGRNHITIKASLDKGLTWLPENQVMLDEDEGWGYTCLTMIDRETVGILYESSVAHMTFQAIKLKDLIRE